jgi:peptide/nickel transport system ATP-binding protein
MNASATEVRTSATGPVLSARDLHTWFELRQWGFLRVGSVRAVDGVTFDLKAGEAVAFVGESGCGKSSLARTLLGLHQPTRGEVIFEGRSLGTLDAAERKAYLARVGYVQQDPYGALPPFMDVRRILHEPLIVHGVRDRAERDRRAREALEEVRLSPPEDFLSKFPHMLSGGQQQRVVIARALILRPAMIIADEPVSMLDASVRVEILQLLRRIQTDHGLTLAFITHDLSTVRHFAERIFVMYAGRIVEQAEVNELLNHPQHPYTPSPAHRDRRPGSRQCAPAARGASRGTAQPVEAAGRLPLSPALQPDDRRHLRPGVSTRSGTAPGAWHGLLAVSLRVPPGCASCSLVSPSCSRALRCCWPRSAGRSSRASRCP